LLALLLVATAPSAQVQYQITDIGAVSDLNPESGEDRVISDRGAIVGQMFDPSADATVSAFHSVSSFTAQSSQRGPRC
jgi:hypothetical protein